MHVLSLRPCMCTCTCTCSCTMSICEGDRYIHVYTCTCTCTMYICTCIKDKGERSIIMIMKYQECWVRFSTCTVKSVASFDYLSALPKVRYGLATRYNAFAFVCGSPSYTTRGATAKPTAFSTRPYRG